MGSCHSQSEPDRAAENMTEVSEVSEVETEILPHVHAPCPSPKSELLPETIPAQETLPHVETIGIQETLPIFITHIPETIRIQETLPVQTFDSDSENDDSENDVPEPEYVDPEGPVDNFVQLERRLEKEVKESGIIAEVQQVMTDSLDTLLVSTNNTQPVPIPIYRPIAIIRPAPPPPPVVIHRARSQPLVRVKPRPVSVSRLPRRR